MLVCVAMGAQNSVGNSSNHIGINTVIITGNLQKLATGLVQFVQGSLTAAQYKPLAAMGCVVAATICGSAAGAVSFKYLESGDWCFVPIALMQFALLLWHDYGAFDPPTSPNDSPKATADRARDVDRTLKEVGVVHSELDGVGAELEQLQEQRDELVSNTNRQHGVDAPTREFTADESDILKGDLVR